MTRPFAPNSVAASVTDNARLLSAVIENSPECIKIVSADGTLLDMNSAGLRLVAAHDVAQIRGRSVYDLIAPEFKDDFRRMTERVCSGEREALEFEIIGLDSTRRVMSTTAVPLTMPDGAVAQLAITRDISAEKRARTELQQALEAAESASRIKSEFLANVSHEIRTPLTAILGYSEILLADPDGLDPDDSLRTIHRSGQHLLHLLNDILDFSKIEAGRVEVDIQQLDPRELLRDVEKLFENRAAAKSLRFEARVHDSVPDSVLSDSNRLRQILVNLVGNAIKFTEVGTVQAELSVTDADSGSSRLVFGVRDTGIGIPAEFLERLFEPFSQADYSSSRRHSGTGLGLAISRRLVELLEGTISVSSVPGSGTEVTVSLPLIATSATVSGASRRQDEHGERPMRTLEGARLLLAEDSPDNQRLIRHFLRRAGAEVAIVEHGGHAIDSVLMAEANGTPFSAVIMDMQMPVLDGYEATRRLRDQGYDRPIIALTANAMSADREKCLNAGCSEFASKPIDRGGLIEVISKSCGLE